MTVAILYLTQGPDEAFFAVSDDNLGAHGSAELGECGFLICGDKAMASCPARWRCLLLPWIPVCCFPRAFLRLLIVHEQGARQLWQPHLGR